MNHYSIYWIKEEFARFFYYRSDILCRFIKSYHRQQNREDLEKQFQYITMDMPANLLISHILKNQSSNVRIENKEEFLVIDEGTRNISLHIEQKRINFRGDIIHDAESLLFPALRSYQPYFFVVGELEFDFGWVSPVLQLKGTDKARQVLYSYL
ncbi:MAG TPA: sporulation inhibitor of replication protein SirA [Lentibacillus sp.]|uniref:sporulation inhibitor of replication protein SirA n=1 Tax=Lentibacillus sp. TaxID=1925746 RepID=UPI002B4ABF6C|nr:sporulation inhibitor of replication protein SirA [Lentibacillus sp.]HLR63059.1 sporulation inhibitor of replication protein SirA [Lentibacillus sp.]